MIPIRSCIACLLVVLVPWCSATVHDGVAHLASIRSLCHHSCVRPRGVLVASSSCADPLEAREVLFVLQRWGVQVVVLEECSLSFQLLAQHTQNNRTMLARCKASNLTRTVHRTEDPHGPVSSLVLCQPDSILTRVPGLWDHFNVLFLRAGVDAVDALHGSEQGICPSFHQRGVEVVGVEEDKAIVWDDVQRILQRCGFRERSGPPSMRLWVSERKRSACDDIWDATNRTACHFTIYVYEMPWKFTEGVEERYVNVTGSRPNDLTVRFTQNLQEWYLHRAILASPHRVLDPEDADLFFVPFYASMAYHCTGIAGHFDPWLVELEREAMAWVIQQPQWARSGGRDHIFTLGHPHAWTTVRQHFAAALAIRLVVDFAFGLYRHADLCRDIVIPYVAADVPRPDPHHFRPLLIFFRGHGGRVDGGLRREVCRALEDESDVVCLDSTVSGDSGTAFSKGMESARFCLHIRGDTPSARRLYEAILIGCIPVIVSDAIELPFEGFLDYSQFSFFVSESDARKRGYLAMKLRGVSCEELAWKRDALEHVREHFLFRLPSHGRDATASILVELGQRALASRRDVLRRQRRREIDRPGLLEGPIQNCSHYTTTSLLQKQESVPGALRILFFTRHYMAKFMMDRHYFDIYEEATRHPRILEAVLWGFDWDTYNTTISLQQNIAHVYGSPSYFDFVFPALPREGFGEEARQLRDLADTTGVTIVAYDHECFDRTCTRFFNQYGARVMLFAYRQEVCHYSDFAPGRVLVHVPHAIPVEEFRGDVHRSRSTDVLLVGQTLRWLYPERVRLHDMILRGEIPGVIRRHPGYTELQENVTLDIATQKDEYITALQDAKIVLVTSSRYRYALRKYVEASTAGALVVGDIPAEREEEYRKYVVEIGREESASSIRAKLDWWLVHEDARKERAELGQRISSRYSCRHYIDMLLASYDALVAEHYGVFMDDDTDGT